MFHSVLVFNQFLWPYPQRKVKFRNPPYLVSIGFMLFAVLVNLVLLASPPSWFVNWLSPKNQPCAGQLTTTWPRWLLRKSHLEILKFLCLMVKCIFGASATGTHLSLSRSLVNQVKGIYCLGSQLTSWGIVLVSLKRSRAEVSSAN